MKSIILFSIVYFMAFSPLFGQVYSNSQNTYNHDYTAQMNGQQATYGNTSYNQTGNGDIKMNPITDPKTGMLVGHLPLPSNWRIENGIIKGPNGTEAGDLPGGTFLDQQRMFNSVSQVAQVDIIPRIKQLGGTVTNTYALPEIAEFDRQSYARYWKVMPTQDRHEAMGIECNGPDGSKGLVIIHFTRSISQVGGMSMYYMNQLTAKPENFEQAKKDYIYALLNFKVNPQYIAAHNQREQQKSQASWNNHNTRMQNNNAAFQATQKAHVDSYNAASQMSMDTYWNNSAASDRMQEQVVDGIWEQQNMYNPQTGQQIKVQSGYNQYYMNGNNQYMGTNNYNYNPNLDPNMNNTQWQQVQPTNNNQY